VRSALLVGAGEGSGVTALAAFAAKEAAAAGHVDLVSFVTALDLLGGGEGSRAAALLDRFNMAKVWGRVLLDSSVRACRAFFFSRPFISSFFLSELARGATWLIGLMPCVSRSSKVGLFSSLTISTKSSRGLVQHDGGVGGSVETNLEDPLCCRSVLSISTPPRPFLKAMRPTTECNHP
jgi:hypothetical protein